ncbi:MAG: bifunctional folylpolyglutamate synthase/dihydrofolate synthase [Ignavibacteria bacterium]|nr:bifunctional folylpolyglutamate synthase/dihydrofolate synthase [Ignavibacteria bacterium]
MKFGLEGVSRLLGVLDDPHQRFPSIHIAGTNGKGSTASMLAAIFSSAGYRTGLYTSPHLVDFTERIRIDGKSIPRRAVAELTNRLRRHILRHKPTFFEATTAIAFAWFAEKKVDIAIIETGLGGRLDSTNVITPLASVITTIGYEHTDILGNTIAKIAWEKAGIVKKGVPCVTGVEDRTALRVLRKVCREKGAHLHPLGKLRVSLRSESLKGSTVDVNAEGLRYKNLKISLPGRFQIRNTALALSTAGVVGKGGAFAVSESAIRKGLSTIQACTGLEARLSLVREKPRIVLDVAHNPDGIEKLVAALKTLGIKEVVLVFGVMKDKDHVAMLQYLESITREVIAVAARTERSRSASDVAASVSNPRIGVRAALSVGEGVRLAIHQASPRRPILITGSHYVVGEALEFLRAKRA